MKTVGLNHLIRLLWLGGLLGFAIAPWIIKVRFGLTGRHHQIWHFLAFFLTPIVLSEVDRFEKLRRPASERSLRNVAVIALLTTLAAVISEVLEVVRYHISFEWHDLLVDVAGVAIGCLLAASRMSASIPLTDSPSSRQRSA